MKVIVQGKNLVIEELVAQELNVNDLVEVSFGDVKASFIVREKELISQQIKMEEFGYWANKIGRKTERQEKCDFNSIKYSKITDEEVISKLKKESTYC